MSQDWRTSALPNGVTQRLFLVRHGETEASARGRCYGKLDVALSANGVRQMQASAALLKPFSPAAVYSSPRVRAIDSAAAICHSCGLSAIIENSLAELDFGDLEGMRYEEVERQYPVFYQQWMSNPTNVTFPNGESYAQMAARVNRVVSTLVKKHMNETIVVVAHGGVNRIVLANILGLKSEQIFRLDQSYGAVNCIDFYDDTPVLRIMNWLP